MSRYIDAEKFDCVSFKGIPDGYKDTFADGVLYALNRIDEEPTVDAVEVARCENCFYGKPYNEVWYHPKKNSMWCKRTETEHEYGWFCADGMEKVIG